MCRVLRLDPKPAISRVAPDSPMNGRSSPGCAATMLEVSCDGGVTGASITAEIAPNSFSASNKQRQVNRRKSRTRANRGKESAPLEINCAPEC